MLIEKFAPRREMQLPWLLRWFNFTWALIGNDDDGLFGDPWWSPWRLPGFTGMVPVLVFGRVIWLPSFGLLEQSKQWKAWRAVCWWFRNPFHNLFFYVIGIADRPRTFYSSREWGSQGLTFHAVNCTEPWLRWVWLPFVSYRSPRLSTYVGWRPYGAFGFKFNRGK